MCASRQQDELKDIIMASDRLTSHPALLNALQCLDQQDSQLARARKRFGNPPDRFEPAQFSSLVRIILGQQISRQVAVALWGRMSEQGWTDAEALAAIPYEGLQKIGLSRRKAEYIIDLGKAEVSGELNLTELNEAEADIFTTKLISYRGIGGWTVSNYRLFCLADFDAWPGNDLALMEAVKRLKQLDHRPTHAEMDRFADGWRPYRGAAALMLWHLYSCLVRDGTPTG